MGDIAEQTGFSSQAYFSKVFKEKMGYAASDYKEFTIKNFIACRVVPWKQPV
ncbi:MAG: AraC family transcriptional regulator [Lachnospiraceae bacterium]|jgi:transcriptional regulator GlxA family with amidase domain|nr:AraC family transcriptional regulator [Lachnospiraceae bacterium]MCI9134306.1 AraC family transcriptional regulator [Lachnospiraceae bacterium]